MVHGYSLAPLRHRPSAPHSVLNRQVGAAPVGLGWQIPDTQQSAAAQSVLLVHAFPVAPPSPSVPLPLLPAPPVTPPEPAGAPPAAPALPAAPVAPPAAVVPFVTHVARGSQWLFAGQACELSQMIEMVQVKDDWSQ